jgi:predicted lipid carrier protein YhbT
MPGDTEAGMKRKAELDSLEREIEADIHNYVPMTGVKRRNVEAILGAARKTKNIHTGQPGEKKRVRKSIEILSGKEKPNDI